MNPSPHQPQDDSSKTPLQLRQSLLSGIKQGLDDHWNSLQQECDLNLLAAYAEGNLSATECEQVERAIVGNPFSKSVVESVQQRLQMNPGVVSAESALRTSTQSSTADRPTLTESRVSEKFHQRLTRSLGSRSLALAACCVVALGALVWSWRGESQRRELAEKVAQLDDRWKGSLQRESQTAKSLLASQVAQLEPVYLVGAVSPDLIAATLARPSRIRGPQDISPDERVLRDRLSSVALEAVDQFAQATVQSEITHRLEQVSLYMLSGKLQDADRVLTQLERTSGDHVPDFVQASIANARGVWHALNAQQAETRDDEQLAFDRAQQAFRKATEQGDASAWLNWARMLLDRDEVSQAQDAATRYLDAAKPPPEVARQIRVRFALTPP